MIEQKNPMVLAKEIANNLIEDPEIEGLAGALGVLECATQKVCEIKSCMDFNESKLIIKKLSRNCSVSQAMGILELAKQFLMQPVFAEIERNK